MSPLAANRLEEIRRCFDGRIVMVEDHGDSIIVGMFPRVWMEKIARAYARGDLVDIQSEVDEPESSDEDWVQPTKPHLLLIDPARCYVGPAN